MDEKQLEIPDELWRVMQSCEVFCASACCGPDAYDLRPELMRPWVHGAGAEKVNLALCQLDQLSDQARASEGPLGLRFIADLATPAEVLNWLAEVRSCLVEAALVEGLDSGLAQEWTSEEWANIKQRVVNRHQPD